VHLHEFDSPTSHALVPPDGLQKLLERISRTVDGLIQHGAGWEGGHHAPVVVLGGGVACTPRGAPRSSTFLFRTTRRKRPLTYLIPESAERAVASENVQALVALDVHEEEDVRALVLRTGSSSTE
jgi:hypothetical protein